MPDWKRSFGFCRARAGRPGNPCLHQTAPASSSASALLEALEPRTFLSAVEPTIYEQLMVELINRARANPAAEATRYGLPSINEGLDPGTISTAAKQPLAINLFITDAAREHSQWMIDEDTFSHNEPPPRTNGEARMELAGYDIGPFNSGWGENIGWRSFNGSGANSVITETVYRDLFKDFVPELDIDVEGRTHRVTMMDADFREIGAGVIAGEFVSGQTFNALMATQDFAYNAGNAFLTGVVFSDAIVTDQFYTPGEGVGGVTITARRVSDGGLAGETTTWAAGGYSLALPAGTYNITASGGGVPQMVRGNVTIGDQNVKVDFIPGDAPAGPPDLTGEIGQIVGQGAHPVPGDVLTIPVEITNDGATAARGAAVVRYYLSADPFFQADTDIFMGELDVTLNLAPNASKVFKGKVTVPGGAQDAHYYILARIEPGLDIDEADTSNNVAATGGTVDVDWAFGSFSGRKNAKLVLADASGDPVTFTLKGAGSGTVVRNETGLVITLSGTDETSVVTLTGPKGVEGATVASITGGTVKSITFKDVDLDGSITLSGTAKTITLDDVADDHSISIGAGPAGSSVTIKADRVFDLNIDSDTPIKSLTATEWLAPGSSANTIAAPWVGSVTIKGDKNRAIAGDFQANVVVTDASQKNSLGKLTVAGRALHGGVTSAGNVGTVTVGAMSNFTLAAGVKNGVVGVPDSADDFNPFAIGTVNVKGLDDGLDDVIASNVWAATLNKVTLRDVDETNDGTKFGLAGITIKSLTRYENGVKLAGIADNDPNDDFLIRDV